MQLGWTVKKVQFEGTFWQQDSWTAFAQLQNCNSALSLWLSMLFVIWVLKMEAIVPVKSLVKCLPFGMEKFSHFWREKGESYLIKNFESGITDGQFSEKGKLSPQVNCCTSCRNAGKVILMPSAHAEGKPFSPIILLKPFCFLPKMGHWYHF